MKLEIHYNDEMDWAALYVDGKLETSGETYHVEERALTLLCVTRVYDEAFLGGGRECLSTTAEIDQYRERRDEAQAKAQELRDEAELLMREARRLEQLK